MSDDTPELKPCPFCGGPPRLDTSGGMGCVTCMQCQAEGPFVGEKVPRDKVDRTAAEAWNKRVL